MAKSSCNDSHNFNNVFDGDHEQYKVHFIGRVDVVVLIQVTFTFLLYCISVYKLAVNIREGLFSCIIVRVDGWNKAGP